MDLIPYMVVFTVFGIFALLLYGWQRKRLLRSLESLFGGAVQIRSGGRYEFGLKGGSVSLLLGIRSGKVALQLPLNISEDFSFSLISHSYMSNGLLASQRIVWEDPEWDELFMGRSNDPDLCRSYFRQSEVRALIDRLYIERDSHGYLRIKKGEFYFQESYPLLVSKVGRQLEALLDFVDYLQAHPISHGR